MIRFTCFLEPKGKRALVVRHPCWTELYFSFRQHLLLGGGSMFFARLPEWFPPQVLNHSPYMLFYCRPHARPELPLYTPLPKGAVITSPSPSSLPNPLPPNPPAPSAAPPSSAIASSSSSSPAASCRTGGGWVPQSVWFGFGCVCVGGPWWMGGWAGGGLGGGVSVLVGRWVVRWLGGWVGR